MKTGSRLLLLPALMALLTACTGDYHPGDFAADYGEALARYPGAPVHEAWAATFVETYGDFTGKQLSQRLRDLYAEELFFNDTLHSIHDRAALVDYLQRTSERLDDMTLTILDSSRQGADLYLRWMMTTDFRVGFRDIEAETAGMTHLRFNEQGEVILHQDFWDSRQGVFEHIPVVGGVLRWIRNGL